MCRHRRSAMLKYTPWQEMRREPTTHSLAILLKWNSRVPQPVLCRNLCCGENGRVPPQRVQRPIVTWWRVRVE